MLGHASTLSVKKIFYFCKLCLHGIRDNCLSFLIWYIWLNWLCNCSEIYSWRGPRKHKFCGFGCLEERFDCTVCLLSLQPARTVYVWLCMSLGFVVVLCWFGLHNKFLLLLPAVDSHLTECDAECLQHLPLHSITLNLYNTMYRAIIGLIALKCDCFSAAWHWLELLWPVLASPRAFHACRLRPVFS